MEVYMNRLMTFTREAYLARIHEAFLEAQKEFAIKASAAESDWVEWVTYGYQKEQRDLEDVLHARTWYTRQLRALVVLLIPELEMVPHFCKNLEWSEDVRFNCSVPSIPFRSLSEVLQRFAGTLLMSSTTYLQDRPNDVRLQAYRQLIGDLCMVLTPSHPMYTALRTYVRATR